MAKMVYDESYGELSFAQRTAYRRFNVSPSDHDTLTGVFGEQAHDRITKCVKGLAEANDGYYNPRFSDISEWNEEH